MGERNSGATWHSTVLGTGLYIAAISCTSAKTCHLIIPGTAITSTGILATMDGGKTWRKQAIPADVSGIACPGADTCYAVGGMNILATHRP